MTTAQQQRGFMFSFTAEVPTNKRLSRNTKVGTDKCLSTKSNELKNTIVDHFQN